MLRVNATDEVLDGSSAIAEHSPVVQVSERVIGVLRIAAIPHESAGIAPQLAVEVDHPGAAAVAVPDLRFRLCFHIQPTSTNFERVQI